MDDTMGVQEARDNFADRVEVAYHHNRHTIITKYGTPRAVIISYETWQQLAAAVNVEGGDQARHRS